MEEMEKFNFGDFILNRLKKIIGIILSVAILSTGIAVTVDNAVTAQENDYGISNPEIDGEGIVTWDKIKFGNYWQSVEFGEPEPIKWRILTVDKNNNAILLADAGLNGMSFDYGSGDATWKTSTLRSWLNEEFYNEAFNEAEQDEIRQVVVKNNNSETIDKIYLLSEDDVCNSAYGFESNVNKNSDTRDCKATYYARVNGARYSNPLNFNDTGSCCWWLRTSGKLSGTFKYAWKYGVSFHNGNNHYVAQYAIRPVLQVNLSSSHIQDAGEVSADGTVTDLKDGYDNPRYTDDNTIWDCVYFGRYKQNNTILKKEPIEWRVLSVDGDEALLFADKALDGKPYNDTFMDITWKECTLHTWLNDEFYNEAFNEAEKSAIIPTSAITDDIFGHETESGGGEKDKVRLLSQEEVNTIEYGFDSTHDPQVIARCCKATDYAVMKGLMRVREYDTSETILDKNCSWWLQNPDSNYGVDYVNIGGMDNNIEKDGVYFEVFYELYGVRPLLRINLASSVWKASGWVDSYGREGSTDTEIDISPELTDKPKPTTVPTQPAATATPVIQHTAAPIPIYERPDKSEQLPDNVTKLKPVRLLSVRCKYGAKRITGKVSVSGATVRIKVGSRAYKKAVVKGKKFTLKAARLKKNTKITITVNKYGYKKLIKVYKIKA